MYIPFAVMKICIVVYHITLYYLCCFMSSWFDIYSVWCYIISYGEGYERLP